MELREEYDGIVSQKGCMKSPHAEILEGVPVMAHPGSANLLEEVCN